MSPASEERPGRMLQALQTTPLLFLSQHKVKNIFYISPHVSAYPDSMEGTLVFSTSFSFFFFFFNAGGDSVDIFYNPLMSFATLRFERHSARYHSVSKVLLFTYYVPDTA